MPRANNNFTPRETLSWGNKFLLYSVAVTVDLVLQPILGLFFLIPVLGLFIGGGLDLLLVAFVAIGYWLYFKIKAGHGVRRKSLGKQPLYMAINVVVESVLGFLPGWTIFTYLSIRDMKKADAQYNKEAMQKINTSYRTMRAVNDNNTPRYRRGFQQQAA